MKIILTENINNYKKDNIIDVKKGYANYLIKSGKAIIFNEKTFSSLENKIKEKEIINQKKIDAYLSIKEKLEKITLLFELKFLNQSPVESISGKKIINHLKNKHEIELLKKNFSDFKPLKNLGLKIIKIKLTNKIIANLKINIIKKNPKLNN
jgi:ribosomal protein L9